jgi:hypothetical protein
LKLPKPMPEGKRLMRKAFRFSLLLLALLALAASVVWLASRGPEPSVLILRNTGTNSVFVRTWPPLKIPRLALTLRSWPPMAKPVPLNAVILNHDCVVTQRFTRGARIEICPVIPSGNTFQAIERPDGVILTDGFAPATTNLQFRTVWQGSVRRLEAQVNGDGPTNNLFRVIKVENESRPPATKGKAQKGN